jgi:protein ImuA
MRSIQRKTLPPAPDARGALLPWGEGAGGHKIGYGVRPSCSSDDRDEVAYRGSDPIPLPSSARLEDLLPRHRDTVKAARIAALRRGMAKLERAHPGPPAHLSLGVPQMHAHLPGPGLACGVLHEIAATVHGDRPAAFGFLFASTAVALRLRPGFAVLVAQRRCLADFGSPYAHGLVQLGLDAGRLLLVETKSDKDALWALEEALRSPARPAMVVGAIAGGLDLTTSRRLNLAAATHATPLVLLRSSSATSTSAAATRWRIASAPATLDRFGAFAHPRWHVTLERCRNGRTGQWLIEWDHVAHRFCLVEGVADRAPAERSGIRLAG